jgi:hypothetical protein
MRSPFLTKKESSVSKSTLAAAATALILGAFSLGNLAPAEAMTPIGNMPSFTISDSNIQLAKTVIVKKKGHKKTVWVKHKGHRKTVWVYSGKKYGPRYRYKHAGYGYYYGGYWYARPWWTICIGC